MNDAKQRIYLATTGEDTIWDTSGDIVFLAPWCFTKDKQGSFKRDIVFIDNATYTTENILENARYFENIYYEILRELTVSLNALHNTDKSQKYWSVILNPWLTVYINTMHERYSRLASAIKKWGDSLYTHTIAMDQSLAPMDTFEFLDSTVDDDYYNLQLVSHIAVSLGIDCKAVAIENAGQKVIRRNRIPTTAKFKCALKDALLFLQEKMFKDAEVAMVDMYHLNFSDYISLNMHLKAVVSMEHFFPSHAREEFAYDKEKREKLVFKDSNADQFIEIVKKGIQYAIPRYCMEGYSRLCEYADSIRRFPPKVIISSTGWYFNEKFKFYAAERQEQGTKLMGMQHGGNYGFSLYHASLFFEADGRDAFFSWGWKDCSYADKIKILPNPHLSKIKNSAKNDKDYILYISFNTSNYFYILASYPGPDGMDAYCKQQISFFKSIPQKLHSKFYYRPARRDYGRHMEEKIINVMPSVKIANKGSCVDLMRRAKLVVIDHAMTVFIEALAMNVPLVLFWEPALWAFTDESEKHFGLLRETGILYTNPIAAAAKIVDVYENAGGWWRQTAIQDARNNFIETYGYSRKNWRNVWVHELAHM